ncbi:MAG: cupredoxin domain-containing protein [Alphaproteobacteria bacterium]
MYIKAQKTTLRVTTLAAILTLPLASGAWAAGAHGGGHGHGPKIGAPGKSADAIGPVTVIMTDNAFDPATITVRKGQTIRFVVRNKGEFVHEFNIGTKAMHVAHRKEMMKMMESGVLESDRINHRKMNMADPADDKRHERSGKMMGMRGGKMTGGKLMAPAGATSMAHDDPNSVLLEPGKSAEIVWKFATSAKLEFACNVPGHYETGMKGKLTVKQ